MRSCAKIGCGEPAVATIGIRYEARELLVADLLPQRDPNLLDLCEAHTSRLTAPFGWELLDARPVPADPTPAPLGLEASPA
jgi:Protein of unknown function (DUF3499)